MEKLIFTPAKDPIEVPCGSEVHVGMTTTAPYFRVVGFACTKEGMDKANAFARRLVSAYNATRNVPIEILETDPLTLDGVEDTFNRLKAQNAQMMDALEEIAAERDQYSVRAIAKHAIAAATVTEKNRNDMSKYPDQTRN